jgi:FeS assembly SUF system regulator
MIKMTNLADYAVVMMSFMAAKPGKIYSASEIAAATAVPSPTVSKILGAMARGELLVSHRGLNGGFSMARPPENISVADIISVVDGPIALTNCIEHGSGECDMELGCGMRRHWQKINDAVRGALENIPLSALVAPVPDFLNMGVLEEGLNGNR